MKCAIHQPQFLPWLGYLHKINMADKFVFLDDVQFKKNEFQNRNKILVAGMARWMTVPVSFRFGDSIRDTLVSNDKIWRRKLINTLQVNYCKTPYFGKYIKNIVDLIEKDWNDLSVFNTASVMWLLDCFEIKADICLSSELTGLGDNPTQRLIDICRRVGADTYVSGPGGRNYLDIGLFEGNGLKLDFQEFNHPVYPQRHGESGFVSHLSAIDGLFNCGGGQEGRLALGLDIREV